MLLVVFAIFGIRICFATQIEIRVTTIDGVDDEKMLTDLDAFPTSEKFLNFRVKGCNDAHLVFCPTIIKQPPLYHIGIGGWGNTRSILARERDFYEYVDQIDQSGMMNCNSYQPYWVSWENGYIRMGRGNVIDVDILLSYTEQCPFRVQNIELSADQGEMINWTIIKSVAQPLTSIESVVLKALKKVSMCPPFQVIETTTEDSMSVCGQLCVTDSVCSAFRFTSGTGTCELVSDIATSKYFGSAYYKVQA